MLNTTIWLLVIAVALLQPTQSVHDHDMIPKESVKNINVFTNRKSNTVYKVVCYYTSWSQYRPGKGKLVPEDINPFLCTHIIFAFADIKEGLLATFDKNDKSRSGYVGLYEKFNSLKKANPGLKTLLSVGGSSLGPTPFQQISSTMDSRKRFISHAIKFLRETNFDGLDIDWEYPSVDDKINYLNLLKEMKAAFESEAREAGLSRLLMSAAVAMVEEKLEGYDVPAVSEQLDFINLMAYDFYGTWDNRTGHYAPLYAFSEGSEYQQKLSVDYAAKLWVQKGAPKQKLIIGVPTDGRSFTLANPKDFRTNAPSLGPGNPGPYTGQAGMLAHYEICLMLQKNAKSFLKPDMKAQYLVLGNQWVYSRTLVWGRTDNGWKNLQ